MPEYLFRDRHWPIDVAATNGSYLINKAGKKYLDFKTGWGVGNCGWNNKALNSAIKHFKGPTYVMPTYYYEQWETLAKKIVSLMPGSNYSCFRATGGTEAVEIALKISKAYNKRKKFIAFDNAYHGQSLACMALVGLHEDKFGPYPNDYLRLKAGDWEKTTRQAVEAIQSREFCAFISEPIITNLGAIVPPVSFFKEVKNACEETGTIFIMDEVVTGFGRTGKWFGFEHFGIEPDIITIAKGFSSGYAAIGATIAGAKIAESMRFDFSNYSTFGWHPLSTEAALAAISYSQKKALVKKSGTMGKYLAKKLSGFCKPEGKGLCIGFETKNPQIKRACLKDGLIIGEIENRVVLFPPLEIQKKEIDKAAGIIRKNFY
ncbi:MAG: aspartate aminotransferase family protein [Candidatus ainarchaeum sp.]|nr:aspartate aminotransferase family protein [Candidatus ainarchaeum sp.]